MDRYQEAFELAEQARIRGENEAAIEYYVKADALIDGRDSFKFVALHHMWGVALINLGHTEDARWQLQKAYRQDIDDKRQAAICRDFARSHQVDGSLATAMRHIDLSLQHIPLDDLAERGASLGFKAHILLARGAVFEALEMFGTADVLLQRSENRHYELYNLMHFLEALIEHRLGLEDNDDERYFTAAQTPRLRGLVAIYGGPPHQERASQIIERI